MISAIFSHLKFIISRLNILLLDIKIKKIKDIPKRFVD